MQTTNPLIPFASNSDYLEAEFNALRICAARISVRKTAEDVRRLEEDGDVSPYYPGRPPSRGARFRTVDLREQEDRIRREIDARFVVYRADPSRPRLGLDAPGVRVRALEP